MEFIWCNLYYFHFFPAFMYTDEAEVKLNQEVKPENKGESDLSLSP